MFLEGTILLGSEFSPIEGSVIINQGLISKIEEHSTNSTDIILPTFVNSHTHIGDSIAKDAGYGMSLDHLVAPPLGLKHQLLGQATPESLIFNMVKSINFMEANGISAFADFREGGVNGVKMLQESNMDSSIQAIIFGRETTDVLKISDGFGASGHRDANFSHERKTTKQENKLFGIHAGERDNKDIDGALDLEPDFIVHMVHATPEHLNHIKKEDIPVVVCPRSNLVTGVGLPPIKDLLNHTIVALGTDNVMLNSPSIFREMEFISKLFDIEPSAILRMATSSGADIFDLNSGVIEIGKEAKLIVLNGESNNLYGSHDIVSSIVKRASMSDIKETYF